MLCNYRDIAWIVKCIPKLVNLVGSAWPFACSSACPFLPLAKDELVWHRNPVNLSSKRRAQDVPSDLLTKKRILSGHLRSEHYIWAALSEKVSSSMRKICGSTFPHMRKVSSGHLFSIEIFYSIQWFCLRTVKALIRLHAVWSGPSLSAYTRKLIFAWRGPFDAILFQDFWQRSRQLFRIMQILNK